MAVYSNQLFRATSTTGFATLGANTFTATQTITPAANTNALAVTGYSLTGTNAQSLLDLAGTLNTSGNPDVLALRMSITAAGGTTRLLNIYGGPTGVTSVFSVDTAGTVRAANQGSFAGSISITAATGSYSIGGDTSVTRDAAGILAQRNGVAAQTLRVYNTFTDASNYERGVFDWGTTANTLTIGTQAAGTGTARNVNLAAGTKVLAIGALSGNTALPGSLQLPGTIQFGAGSFSQVQSAVNGNIILSNAASTAFGLLQFGGTTSSFPALKVSGATLQARLADDSAFAQIAALDHVSENASFMGRTGVTITGGATGNVPTLTAGPVTGNPTKWLPYDDNGTTRYIPSW